MATGTADSARPSPPASAPMPGYDGYIQEQLDKTRWYVKIVDLFSGLMVWVACVLGYLLAVAVVDAWILPLGFWARLLALVVLIGGSVAYFATRVLPLLIRPINPAYAARTIEECKPTLKNSLINYLFLRSHRGDVRERVYQGVEQQAAAGLAATPVESVIDRSQLIRVGYVLAAVMLVCAAYKILSPKDPFTTLARVAAPLAEITRPSRVRILEVVPGEAEVFHGQMLNVSARIDGLRNSSTASLFYSTADGQIVDQRIEMTFHEEKRHYECVLAPTSSGIQQDLWYRIVAGDAATEEFHVKVRTAPTIVVQSVTYDYPKYTGLPSRFVERQGDLRAVEGTKATIQASANLPIKSAYIELVEAVENGEPEAENAAVQQTVSSARTRSVPMRVEGQKATGNFVLELKADRRTTKYSQYRVQFVTDEGYRNEDPIEHQIEVTADLAPEVHILSPKQDRIDLPENRTATIEIRALDPDYALSQITLRAVAGGTDVVTHDFLGSPAPTSATAQLTNSAVIAAWSSAGPLSSPMTALVGQLPHAVEKTDSSTGHHGQVVVNYKFTPRDHGLVAGDEVIYWSVAADNRMSPTSQFPEPNTARTRNYYIRITASDEPAASEDQPSSRDGSEDRQEGGKDESAGGEKTKPESQPGQEGGEPSESESGTGDKNEGGEGQNDSGASGSGTTGSEPSDAQPADGASEGAAGQGTNNEEPSTDQQQGASDGQSGTGQSTGSETDDNAQGAENDAGGAGTRPGSKSGQPSDRNIESDEPLHDGEVIERVLDHQKRKQDASQSTSGQQLNGANDGQSNSQTEANGQDQQGQPNQGDRETDSSAGNNATNPQGGQPVSQPNNMPPAKGSEGQSDQSTEGGQKDPSQTPNGEPAGSSAQGPSNDQNTSQGKPDGSGSQNSGQSQPRSADGQKPMGDGQSADGMKPMPGSESASGMGDESKPGAGEQSGSEGGSPMAQEENRDREKEQDSSGGGQQESGAKSPSINKRQADSQGDASGDRSGGGQEGGGQAAKSEGNDTPGSSSPADEGFGAAPESGSGETADRQGDDAQAGEQRGKPGTEKGPGSTSRSSPNGQQRVDSPGSTPGTRQGKPLDGGGTANTTGESSVSEDVLPPGEKANLEYARKATDLALEYLKEQKENPDRELLDDLNWTEDDMRRFVERWESLKHKADRGGSDERQRLDESLRSLGLRPARDTRRGVGAANDDVRGLSESGTNSNPPPEFIEGFKAFIKGTARADDE